MHLISSYVPPSATSHAIKCHLGEDLLIAARVNRLDVYEPLPDGVRLATSLELLPRIVALHEITPDVSHLHLIALDSLLSHKFRMIQEHCSSSPTTQTALLSLSNIQRRSELYP